MQHLSIKCFFLLGGMKFGRTNKMANYIRRTAEQVLEESKRKIQYTQKKKYGGRMQGFGKPCNRKYIWLQSLARC